MLRFLVGGFALIGLGTVAWWVWSATLGASPPPDGMRIVASPDGAYKAVLAGWNGGGAIAPFCYDKLFVVPQSMPDDQVLEDSNLVFESDCRSFEVRDGASNPSPELSWRGPRELLVKFAINSTSVQPATVRLRERVAGRQVTVDFEIGR